MFIDSEKLDYIKNHSDSDYSNHTWIGGAHAEGHRYDDAYADYQRKCKADSGKSCVDLESALNCITKKRDSAKLWSTGSRGARRVRDRHLKATLNWKNKIKKWYDDKNCAEKLAVSVGGCMDRSAKNYDNDATYDDGSCKYPDEAIYGCKDKSATNYDDKATVDDGSCKFPSVSTRVYGCMSKKAKNYNPEATHSDGSCEFDEQKIQEDLKKEYGIIDVSQYKSEEDNNTTIYAIIGAGVLVASVLILKD